MLRSWPARRWWVALVTAALTVLVVGFPTVLIPNSVFGRSVEPTWWSWPALIVTAVLSGLLAATYIASPLAGPDAQTTRSRVGLLGGFLTYLAVGCPACNKIALIALGSTGAVQWFAPVQPVLAVVGVALLGYALARRVEGERSCRVRPMPPAVGR